MSYLQYLALTMGLRWLLGYIKSTGSGRTLKEEEAKPRVEFTFQFQALIFMLIINFVSYKLLCYGLPPFVKMIKEVIGG